MNIRFLNHRPLFLLFSALNHHGYDLEGNSEMHAIRLFVRQRLASLPRGDYFRRALPGWPRAHWLATTLLCLDASLSFTVDPHLIWDEIAWESPEPLDSEARQWLAALPEQLATWSAQTEVTYLWPEYLQRISQCEPPGLRAEIADLVQQYCRRLPRVVNHDLIVLPNYLQSDWSVDPVCVNEKRYVIVGPLSLRVAGGIMHELLHEYFTPCLVPLRHSLGRYLDLLQPQQALLMQWGYWHQTDANKTVYKVLGECSVRAAQQLLQAKQPAADWQTYGLDLAYQLHDWFADHGYFGTQSDVLHFLAAVMA